ITHGRASGSAGFAAPVGSGGAIDLDGVLTLSHVAITDNEAPGGGYGGAINGFDSALNISDSTITNNRTEQGPGGGVMLHIGVLAVTRSVIDSNSAGGGAGYGSGGGIHSNELTTYISDSAITNNVAGGDAGGLALFATSPTITNSTISGNV